MRLAQKTTRVLVTLLCVLVAGGAAAGAMVSAISSGNTCVLCIQGREALVLADLGTMSAGMRAELVVIRLQNLMEFGDVESISLDLSGPEPVIRTNLGILVTADDNSAKASGVADKYELAKLWNIRLKQAISMSLAQVQPENDRPYERRETQARAVATKELEPKITKDKPVKQVSARTMEGTASWYGPGFHGRRTASGDIYNQNLLTAAHRSLPFGTRLLIKEHTSGKTVEVIVNDRGPFVNNRILDLSLGAARQLGFVERGVARITATVLPR